VIQRWKDRGWLPADVPASEQKKELRGKAIRFYQDYQARLKNLNALDFGDMILLCLVLFRDFPEVLRHYQQQFRYILVDEYQDTNVSQYLWLRLLAQGHGNLCCVGDDDQSIYGWRGAEVDNILRFDQDFPGAKVIKLEQNYRSTQTILTAASHLIQNNQGRLGKTLWTDDQTGEKIAVHHVWDSAEESRLLAKSIEKRAASGHPLGQMALLVRASFQTRELEEALMNAAIPYQVIGGLRFYDRQEIRDALAYLRLTTQIDDDLALDRIINLPKRGIGSTTVQTLAAEAERLGISIYRLLLQKNQTGELFGRGGKPLQQFVMMIEGWRNHLSRCSPAEMMAMILDESGYTAMWKETKTPDAEARLDNVKELVTALHAFDSLNTFLEHVMLVADTAEAGDGDKVSIMTMHAAKGLEFDTVFLPGWEEGIFPNQRAIDESGDKGVEEERRLAYVGLTRARKQAIISYANSRRKFNSWQYNPPSRFLQELPSAHIHHHNHNKAAGSPGAFGQYGGGRSAKTLDVWEESQDSIPILPLYNPSRTQGMRQAFAASHKNPAATVAFRPGQTVRHNSYGPGVVATILDADKLEVTFLDDGLTRTVMAKWVEG
jgi:DNA helicase-2/ATP-dependent DNA helicase PcrA